jgi:hypothetical protein
MTVFWDAKFFLHGRVSLEGSFIHEQTDYSKAALRYDLGRLQDAWRKFQRSRARDAVYCFLEEIFDLAAWWKAEGRSRSRIDRVLAIKSVPRPKLTSNSTAYAVLIRAAAHPEELDKRTISKWSRALQHADDHKPTDQPLDEFVKARGGINGCAAEYSECLRRLSKLKRNKSNARK